MRWLLLLFVGLAQASTVTLSTGPSCSYNSMSVDASGNVTVQCLSFNPPAPHPLPTQPLPRPTVGCPAFGGQVRTFGNAGDKLEITAHSGQVTAIALPKVPVDGSKGSGYLNILDSPGLNSPPSSVLELSISKCPGVMDTCTKTFRDVGYVSQYWFARTTPRFNTAQSITSAGACYAPESEGQWYLNVRWTYQACGFGASTCGFKFYWSPGSH